ncbi:MULTISPECIES: helix-turn-helix domain-containing protein [Halobacteriovorax]|nr:MULTISPECIES: helix-turn-helix domain-containing protein [Halobacteriovorax]
MDSFEYAGYKDNYKRYTEQVDRDNPLSTMLFDNLEWLTTAEAAYYLRKSKDAIRQMVCRGQLRARKFHRRLYFRKVELDQALDTSFY